MRTRLLSILLALGLIVVAAAMIFGASLQRQAATRSADRLDAANALLTGMIDQETGFRGFMITGLREFLEPYDHGREHVAAARRELIALSSGDRDVQRLLAEHELLRRQWVARVESQITRRERNAGYRSPVADYRSRKHVMDGMRRVSGELRTVLRQEGSEEQGRARTISTALFSALTALLGIAAAGLIRTESRRRRAAYDAEITYRVTQREFTDALQAVGSEAEAHELLKRHIELRVDGTHATVLARNNSDNRLQPTTPIPDGSPIAKPLEQAQPSSCLAVRLGREHRSDPNAAEPALLECEVCGKAGPTICEPLLVSGHVIGSVLIEHHGAVSETHERRLVESVSQAAPVLANLRNLVLAERRAATDALTGLPNRRAIADTLTRMSAQASRNAQPLAAISIDLDHFKDINDGHGHDMGDTVLAQVGQLLTSSLRASDFAGRQGGEEFVVLAPNTNRDGALILAENLRRALERETVPGLGRPVTASFGVAVLPDDAGTAEGLLRLSDRALYAAKTAGRNCVRAVDADAAPLAQRSAEQR